MIKSVRWFTFLAITVVFLSFSFSSGANESSASELPPLIVTNSDSWKPFSYIDSEGQPQGILIDFWRAYEKESGRKIKFVLTTWNESIELVKNGQADVHAGLARSKPREEFLEFGHSFFSVNSQLFLSQNLVGVNIDDFLTGNVEKGVGVVRGGYEEYFARENYPTLTLIPFETNKELMFAAFDEDIDAFITDLQVANFYINTSNVASKYVSIRHMFTAEVYPAVAKGRINLINTIDDTYLKVGEKKKEQILNQWMHIETVYPKYMLPGIGLFILVFSIIYIFQLRSTVKAKTKDLEKANQDLIAMTYTDPLTNISNRRYFMQQIVQMQDYDTSVAVMVFDIDDFKLINDTFGHTHGDMVIQEVAMRVKKTVGESLFARIGGEEFAVVVMSLDFDAIQSLCDSICRVINDTHMTLGDHSATVSVSIGCAYYSMGPAEVSIFDADNLMYQAKEQGKNRVVLKHID